jgi:signal transduction histidine kinase
MTLRAPSLRLILLTTIIVTAVLGSVVSASLMVLAKYSRRTGADLEASVELVRVSEEAEIALLLRGLTKDPLVRTSLEGDLRRDLSAAKQYATTDERAALLERAKLQVDRYLADPESQTRLQSAYAALKAFVELNVAESQTALRRSAYWDDAASRLGVSTAILVLGLAAWLLWWMRVRAFSPLFALAAAIERYAAGDRNARAEERGATELALLSLRFNEMAAHLDAERERRRAFLAGVAHDLKNPLSAMKLSVALAPASEPLPPEPRVRRILQLVERQLVRLDRMVGDFLDAASIDAGRLQLQMQPIDARATVRHVCDLFEATSPEHPIALVLPTEPVVLMADALRLEQVLANLVSNAIKYSPSGGRISVSVESRGLQVLLTVADQGVGMSEEELRRVSEPFVRTGPLYGSVPGTGLGLYIVRRLVEAHGGATEIESRPGAGTSFRVFLPIAQRNGAAPIQPHVALH